MISDFEVKTLAKGVLAFVLGLMGGVESLTIIGQIITLTIGMTIGWMTLKNLRLKYENNKLDNQMKKEDIAERIRKMQLNEKDTERN